MEIKNCPFCGVKPEIIKGKGTYCGFRKGIHRCKIIGFIEIFDWIATHKIKQAIKAWNTRVSPWVKCSDGLPEEGKEVLTMSNEHNHIVYDLAYIEHDPKNEKLIWFVSWTPKSLDQVIAWMPIPEFKEI